MGCEDMGGGGDVSRANGSSGGTRGCILCIAVPPLSVGGLGQLLALPGTEKDLSLYVSPPRQ